MRLRDNLPYNHSTSPAHLTSVIRITLALSLLGCAPHRVTRDPAPPTVVPAAFAAGAGTTAAPDRWWTSFGDPALDRLVGRALTDNFQLKAAWARVAQAHAGVRQLGQRLPELTATGSAARQKNRFVLPDPVGEVTVSSNSFSLQAAAAYEVDVWRRLGSQRAGAAMDAMALRDDVEAIAISLAGEISEAWLDIRASKARLVLLEQQLATNQASLEVLESRFKAGLLPSILDVYQQRSLVAQVRGQMVGARASLDGSLARLAVLVGTTTVPLAKDVEQASPTLPTVPPLPAAGVPADLLERRPDVRAARRRVVAADYRVAAAVSDRLPSLRMQGSVGLSSATLTDLIATPLWSILGAVTAPLFDNGRRAAAVAQQKAIVGERIAGYGGAMLTAMTEVESALAQEKHQLALVEELVTQRDLAIATVREARERYRGGQVDYLPVLSALQGEQRVQLAVLDATRQHLSLRVRLYRALGGTWTRDVAPTKPLAPTEKR